MNTDTDDKPLGLTADQVARQLQIPTSRVESFARRGELGSRKIGRYRRFLQEDVDDFLAAHRVAGTNPLALSARSQAALRRKNRA